MQLAARLWQLVLRLFVLSLVLLLILTATATHHFRLPEVTLCPFFSKVVKKLP